MKKHIFNKYPENLQSEYNSSITTLKNVFDSSFCKYSPSANKLPKYLLHSPLINSKLANEKVDVKQWIKSYKNQL